MLQPVYTVTLLFLLYILMFWIDLPAFRPGMDAMTYGAIARNMALHGDWAVPHYTTQAYSNFFQHPPLGLWMMAGSMKFFALIGGNEILYADWILKIVPALLAGTCAYGVYLLGRRIRGESFAFLATLVLLTSTRFAKYSRGFMLDPFLATFSVWAIYFACGARVSARGKFFAFLSGLFVTAAFLSKGLFAFAPLTVISIVIGRPRILLFLLGFFFPLAIWFGFGDATTYLSHYYSEHVADRMGHHPLLDHFGPILNLGKLYWPWLPFFLAGAWMGLKKLPSEIRARRLSDESMVLLTTLAFIGGFTIVASFLEQYHTATYPFAALVTAAGIPLAWERYREKSVAVLLAIAAGFAIYLVTHPYSMQGTEYKNPIRFALKNARVSCNDPAIRRITISTGVAEIWYALAMGSWNTGWDPHSDIAMRTPEETDSQILLASATEPVGPGWIPVRNPTEGYRIYRSFSAKCAD